ncbi:MAG: hypothetical protein CK528_04870 [Alcaligenaceae bacterium]|nr:MAG: hypothetical protein CK528_04870 [Alcaligenaceae bacterium]
MKWFLLIVSTALMVANAHSFEILALGTSNTNCQAGGHAYTNTLNEQLSAQGIKASVINAGVNGDKPTFMLSRLEQALKSYPNIKLVLFEPGPNEQRKRFNVEYTEKILSYLQDIKMPTIYSSTGAAQTREEAKMTAQKYGAYYYGHWGRDVPRDKEHYTFDGVNSASGHMNKTGCTLWAKNTHPLILQVIKDKNIN